MQDDSSPQKIKIGVSSCLLGNEVRYNGAHTHNRYITENLGEFFEFVAFCPEVAIGLGIPRPPIQLVQIGTETRVRGRDNPEQDVTEALVSCGRETSANNPALCGYIFKSKSPSCGMERVKIYAESGQPVSSGSGLFAQTIMMQRPELPCEEEGRLMNPQLRENFIERIFVYARWQRLLQDGLTPASLVEFHTRHKFILLAHDEPVYRALGQQVSAAGKADLQELANGYIRDLMQALRKLATPGQHANVLMHIIGFFKKNLREGDKQELLDAIDDYRRSLLPLIVPVTLIKHYLRIYPEEYISKQYYLNPHPRELMLRNHV